MVIKSKYVRAGLIALLVLHSLNAEAGRRATSASVCELTARSSFYDHKVVIVRASVRGSGLHALRLKDEKCLTAQDVAIGEARDGHRRHLQKFMNAVGAAFRESTSTRQMHVEATFVGTFRAHSNDLPSSELLLTDVSSMKFVEGKLVPEIPAPPKK